MSWLVIIMVKTATDPLLITGKAHMVLWSVKVRRTGALQATLFMYQDITGWKNRFKS
nr:MAG TPA: hypothetical protein [Caudoviricetes sp.]